MKEDRRVMLFADQSRRSRVQTRDVWVCANFEADGVRYLLPVIEIIWGGRRTRYAVIKGSNSDGDMM